MHHTKDKADLAVAKTISTLVEKGFAVFISFTDHLPFDIIAYKDSKVYRIQVKYRTKGYCPASTTSSDKNGLHEKFYSKNDFDYYAIYIMNIDKVIFPSISFAGKQVRSVLPKSPTPFYWFEDFLDFTDHAEKKTFRDFNVVLKGSIAKGSPRLNARAVTWPTKEELEKLLWEKPTYQVAKAFGVSDKAVENWSKKYGIKKPPRGYWATINSNKRVNWPGHEELLTMIEDNSYAFVSRKLGIGINSIKNRLKKKV